MKKAILTFSFACFITAVFGQALYLEYPSFYLKFSGGIGVPFNKVISGQFTDPLLQYNDGHSYIDLTSGFFFGEHFGFEINLVTCEVLKAKNNLYHFKQNLEERYGDDYYFTARSLSPKYESFFYGRFDKFFVSLLYRINKEKAFIMPKLSIGATAIPLHRRDILLKEKNGNNYSTLRISPDSYSDAFFTLGPGLTLGRRVFNQLVLALDIQYYWTPMDFSYKIVSRDLVTKSSSTELIPYDKNIHGMNIGVGLIYNIKYGKIPNPEHPATFRPKGRYEATGN